MSDQSETNTPDAHTLETVTLEEQSYGEQPSNGAALMRWIAVIAVTFAVLAAGFLWISRSQISAANATSKAMASSPGSERTHPDPDFRLASLAGETIGPGDFKDQAVVIDFWATWCGPCKIQAKMLEKLHEEVGDHVRFLAVNVGEDMESVQRYVEKTPFSYSVLLDPQETLSAKYQIYGLPTMMVINRLGKVSFLRTGLTDIPTLRRELTKAGVDL